MPTIEITSDSMNYLKGFAEPFVDTPATVLDRIIAEHRTGTASSAKLPTGSQKTPIYNSSNLPNLAFTKVKSALISNKPTARPKWKTLVVAIIEHAAERGKSPEEIKSALKALSCLGERSDTGYEFVKSAGISFQGLDSNRSCEATLGIAEAFGIPVKIDFIWRDDDKAAKPGQSGRIECP